LLPTTFACREVLDIWVVWCYPIARRFGADASFWHSVEALYGSKEKHEPQFFFIVNAVADDTVAQYYPQWQTKLLSHDYLYVECGGELGQSCK